MILGASSWIKQLVEQNVRFLKNAYLTALNKI